ncbi:hypothetical protein [Streptacidiphilus albus]|uniref:hypothetical protein n=1 Tax=Streptacidiphilus albus TaxID=105425 RepID=UPI001E38B41A|nr:hypothetical protein [Streptacidiphilus albus]
MPTVIGAAGAAGPEAAGRAPPKSRTGSLLPQPASADGSRAASRAAGSSAAGTGVHALRLGRGRAFGRAARFPCPVRSSRARRPRRCRA